MSDRWHVEGVTDFRIRASFSVSFVRFAYDIQAEISVAPGLGLPGVDVDAYALELLQGGLLSPRGRLCRIRYGVAA